MAGASPIGRLLNDTDRATAGTNPADPHREPITPTPSRQPGRLPHALAVAAADFTNWSTPLRNAHADTYESVPLRRLDHEIAPGQRRTARPALRGCRRATGAVQRRALSAPDQAKPHALSRQPSRESAAAGRPAVRWRCRAKATSSPSRRADRRSLPPREPQNLLPDRADVLRREGGYVDLDGDGGLVDSIGSGVLLARATMSGAEDELEYARRHFFLPRRLPRPVRQHHTRRLTTRTIWCRSRRATRSATRSAAEFDYRVLAPGL